MTRTALANVALAAALASASGCSDSAPGGLGFAPVETLSCSAIDGGFLFEYQIVWYDDGSVWTSCSVSDDYVEAGESSFWLDAQVGSDIAACAVTLDISGEYNGGWWLFEIQPSGAATATYDDPGDELDGTALEYTQAGCTLAER
jgi:hypothetical protein